MPFILIDRTFSGEIFGDYETEEAAQKDRETYGLGPEWKLEPIEYPEFEDYYEIEEHL